MTRTEFLNTGNEWTGGEHHRIYLDEEATMALIGLSVGRYRNGRGNIKAATLNGEEISNNAAHKLLFAFNVYYDIKTKEFGSRNRCETLLGLIRAAFEALPEGEPACLVVVDTEELAIVAEASTTEEAVSRFFDLTYTAWQVKDAYTCFLLDADGQRPEGWGASSVKEFYSKALHKIQKTQGKLTVCTRSEYTEMLENTTQEALEDTFTPAEKAAQEDMTMQDEKTTFYVIEESYTGPNPFEARHADQALIKISTAPALTNSSKEECLAGWCGTTQDICVTAHGAYPTLEAARAAIKEIFGEVRDSAPDGSPFEAHEDTVLEIYKPGAMIPMDDEAIAVFLSDFLEEDVTAHTTDKEIETLFATYEKEANESGSTMDKWHAISVIEKYRDALLAEAQDEDN